MGDTTPLSTSDAQHLLRRSGFGARQDRVAAFTGMTRGDAADLLLSLTPAKFKPGGRYIEDRHNSWVRHMVNLRDPLREVEEKLVLFWHDHFATNDGKVDNPKLMASQNLLFRKFCKGNFKDFVKAINKDAAIIEFLDTVRNFKEQPNENYARELQELFTLGVKDYNGNHNYAQEDIVQIARAFSGWSYNNRGKATFDSGEHDFNAEFGDPPPAGRGMKIIYGVNYAPTPADEGPQEIDAVIDIIFNHTDNDSQKTVARFITGKLFTYYAQPYPKRPAQAALKGIVDQLITDSSFDTLWDISKLLRAIFVSDAFYDKTLGATTALAPYGASDKKSVKWPIDFVVSTLRILNVRLKTRAQYTDGGDFAAIRDQLIDMGQILFEPPSVFGWDWETAWISSATLLARYNFARDIASARGSGHADFHPQSLSSQLTALAGSTTADPAQIVDEVLAVLGLTDDVTSPERTNLIDYLTDNGLNPTLDLTDYDTRNAKLNGVFALALQLPAYQLH